MRKVAAGRLVMSGRRVATLASVVRMEWLVAPRNFAHVSASTDWGRRERRERSGLFREPVETTSASAIMASFFVWLNQMQWRRLRSQG